MTASLDTNEPEMSEFMDDLQKKIARLERRVERERSARKQAESLLESKSLELYELNQDLEARVEQRTGELEQSNARLQREIHQHTKTSRALETALKRAEESSKLKSEFLSMVSHELRTPLNAVLGMATILGYTSLDEDQRAYIGNIQTAGQSLLKLLAELLDYTEMLSSEFILSDDNVNTRDFLEEVAGHFGKAASNRELLLLTCLAPDTPCSFTGDRDRVQQVLAHLMTNALNFTESGGVLLCAKPSAGGKKVRFSVCDTGIGIHPDKHISIFEPFRQIDGSTTRKIDGVGMGLAICQRLCEKFDSQLVVESSPGEGTKFWFEIDAVTEPALTTPTVNLNAINLYSRNPLTRRLIHEWYTIGGGRSYELRHLADATTESSSVAVIDRAALPSSADEARRYLDALHIDGPIAIVGTHDEVALKTLVGPIAPWQISVLSSAPPQQSADTVFVIEDNRVDLMLLSRLLQQIGYKVESSPNIEDAESAYSDPRIAYVVMGSPTTRNPRDIPTLLVARHALKTVWLIDDDAVAHKHAKSTLGKPWTLGKIQGCFG